MFAEIDDRRVYVTAEFGTNANSMRKVARAKMNATPCPEYVNSVTGERSPGKWAQHLGQSNVWLATGHTAKPDKRLYWNLQIIPL